MKRGHATGHKRQRKPRASTIARDAQQAAVIAQMAAELAKQMMADWQVK